MNRRRTLALLMWGDLFEDFFDSLDVTLETFRTEVTGGWLFGYVDALTTVQVDTVLIFCSARVRVPQRFVHGPTNARVVVLPAPRRHRLARLAKRWLPRRKALTSLVSYLSIPLLRMVREWRRYEVDAVLLQEYEHPRFDVCVALGRLCDIPVFATFQGGDAPGSRLERRVRRHAVRACAGVIIAAATERQRVNAVYGLAPEVIADIPNAMDVAGFTAVDRSTARSLLGIAPSATVVEWHGRVTMHHKGLDVLLLAWDILGQLRPSAELLLLLVGTGADADVLRRGIEAMTSGSVRWHDGYITDRAALMRYLSAADIYVLPSRHEGFPVAPIEAMAAGLPVVAADAPGVADILADREPSGGVVVPRADAEALAAALAVLIDDPARRRDMGLRARLRAEQHYSLNAVGGQLRTFLFP